MWLHSVLTNNCNLNIYMHIDVVYYTTEHIFSVRKHLSDTISICCKQRYQILIIIEQLDFFSISCLFHNFNLLKKWHVIEVSKATGYIHFIEKTCSRITMKTSDCWDGMIQIFCIVAVVWFDTVDLRILSQTLSSSRQLLG